MNVVQLKTLGCIGICSVFIFYVAWSNRETDESHFENYVTKERKNLQLLTTEPITEKPNLRQTETVEDHKHEKYVPNVPAVFKEWDETNFHHKSYKFRLQHKEFISSLSYFQPIIDRI